MNTISDIKYFLFLIRENTSRTYYLVGTVKTTVKKYLSGLFSRQLRAFWKSLSTYSVVESLHIFTDLLVKPNCSKDMTGKVVDNCTVILEEVSGFSINMLKVFR